MTDIKGNQAFTAATGVSSKPGSMEFISDSKVIAALFEADQEAEDRAKREQGSLLSSAPFMHP